MDPWSKVDYSRLVRKASMVVEKLAEVNPPSDRVPGQGLLAARSWKRGGGGTWGRSRKRVLSLRVSEDGVNIGRRGARGWPRVSRRPPDVATRGSRPQGAWTPVGPPLALLRGSVR